MVDANLTPVHLAFPFARDASGDLAMVEQDTREHVMTQVNVVVRYPLGFLGDEPDFGIPRPEFTTAPIDADAIADAVREQVPAATDIDAHEFAGIAGAAYRVVELEIGT